MQNVTTYVNKYIVKEEKQLQAQSSGLAKAGSGSGSDREIDLG